MVRTWPETDLAAAAEMKAAEPTCVITTRIPKSLRAKLRTLAHQHEISLNSLCAIQLAGLVNMSADIIQWCDSRKTEPAV